MYSSEAILQIQEKLAGFSKEAWQRRRKSTEENIS